MESWNELNYNVHVHVKTYKVDDWYFCHKLFLMHENPIKMVIKTHRKGYSTGPSC